MRVKETIAFIGNTGKTCLALINQLAQENLRLLFVSGNEEQLQALYKELNSEEVPAEIELLLCPRDCCWEADIIAFTEPSAFTDDLLKKIKEVATQKIILNIHSEKKGDIQAKRLEHFFPNSKVLDFETRSETMEAVVTGKNCDALQTVAGIFENVNYKIRLVEEN